MFKGVLFDLDGVITILLNSIIVLGESLVRNRHMIDHTFNEQLKGVSREDSLSLLFSLWRKRTLFSKEEFAELAKRKTIII